MESRNLPARLLVLLTSFTFACPAVAQPAGYHDRLARVRDLVNSQELVMIWNQGPNVSAQSCYQRIYKLDLTQPAGVDSTLVPKPLQVDSAISGRQRLAVASGNFLGGEYKNFVAAWSGPGDSVTVAIPHIQPGTLSWTNAERFSVPGLAPFGSKTKIHVAAGDFYGNEQDEFALAFEGADTAIHLMLYSFDQGSLVPHLRGSIHDERAMAPGTNLDNWDLVTGDFDGDGYQDIALLFVKPLTGGDWGLYAKIYSVDDQGDLVPKGSQEIFHRPAYTVTDVNVSGASGDFDADAALEIAFGFSFFQGDQSGPDTYVYLLDVRNSLMTIVADDTSRIVRDDVGPNEMPPFNVRAGSLDRSGHDDVVVMSGSTFYVYSTDDHRVPTYLAQGTVLTPGDNNNSDCFLAVGDMDLDQRAEIVVAKSFYDTEPGGLQHFEIMIFSLDSLHSTFTLKARRLNEEPILTNNGIRNFAIALGDFTGDRVRLGEPVHYRKTGVIQPTVILYSPPTEYDIFDTTIYDLSGCYPGESCGFNSSYVQSTTVDTTITTEVHEDWGGDASVFVQNPAFSTKVAATYGNNFSRQSTSSTSYTITTGRIAAGDDWLYANVFDIDFYEYPVYNGSDPTPVGHFLVSIPGAPRPLWIEGKDDNILGNLFRPDHEVGNVLSYPLVTGPDTSRVITDFPEQTIGGTGSSLVSLQLSTFQENKVQSSWDAGLEVTATLGSIGSVGVGVGEFVQASVSWPVGIEVSVTGTYNTGQISTQTVSVGQSLEVESDLGHLQPAFATTGTYYVRPYAYWTSYGALALDYKVSALPTAGNSFWQVHYGGKPDLTFSLPWRHDLQKGFPLPNDDPSYVERTRDIFLSNPEPHGGDTVGIYVRVRNLGLQAVTSPVTVRVYKGDPSAGGMLLGEAVIDSTIAPRTWQVALVPWAIPLGESLFSDRIYAVVDPGNTIPNEVHEDNNTGWAPAFSLGGGVTGVAGTARVPQGLVLYPAYPNPFNPMTTIRFDLPATEKVSLKVYDVLGQEVVTLSNDVWQAGTHQIHFNAAGLASGVYFYRMETTPIGNGGRHQLAVRKVLLIK
jgi:hypothetical protein